jgi:hypothetical protein
MIRLIARSTGHGVRRICESLPGARRSCYHAAAPTESQRSDARMSQAIRRPLPSSSAALRLPPHLEAACRRRHPLALQIECAASCKSGVSSPSNPKSMCRRPAVAARICPHPTCSSISPCQASPTKCGPETSRSSPVVKNGSIWPSSPTSAPGASSAGPWPIPCAALWSSMP